MKFAWASEENTVQAGKDVSFAGSMASALLKQLKAADTFLGQIRRLQSFEASEEKQAQALVQAVQKMVTLKTASAVNINEHWPTVMAEESPVVQMIVGMLMQATGALRNRWIIEAWP